MDQETLAWGLLICGLILWVEAVSKRQARQEAEAARFVFRADLSRHERAFEHVPRERPPGTEEPVAKEDD